MIPIPVLQHKITLSLTAIYGPYNALIQVAFTDLLCRKQITLFALIPITADT